MSEATESVLAEFGPADENGDHRVWSERANMLATALADTRKALRRITHERDSLRHFLEIRESELERAQAERCAVTNEMVERFLGAMCACMLDSRRPWNADDRQLVLKGLNAALNTGATP